MKLKKKMNAVSALYGMTVPQAQALLGMYTTCVDACGTDDVTVFTEFETVTVPLAELVNQACDMALAAARDMCNNDDLSDEYKTMTWNSVCVQIWRAGADDLLLVVPMVGATSDTDIVLVDLVVPIGHRTVHCAENPARMLFHPRVIPHPCLHILLQHVPTFAWPSVFGVVAAPDTVYPVHTLPTQLMRAPSPANIQMMAAATAAHLGIAAIPHKPTTRITFDMCLPLFQYVTSGTASPMIMQLKPEQLCRTLQTYVQSTQVPAAALDEIAPMSLETFVAPL